MENKIKGISLSQWNNIKRYLPFRKDALLFSTRYPLETVGSWQNIPESEYENAYKFAQEVYESFCVGGENAYKTMEELGL